MKLFCKAKATLGGSLLFLLFTSSLQKQVSQERVVSYSGIRELQVLSLFAVGEFNTCATWLEVFAVAFSAASKAK